MLIVNKKASRQHGAYTDHRFGKMKLDLPAGCCMRQEKYPDVDMVTDSIYYWTKKALLLQ